MDPNGLSPYIRVALDNELIPGWLIKERVLFDYELLYIKEGAARITVMDEVYHGKPGDIFLFKPKQRHSILNRGAVPVRQPHIHFDLYYQPDSPDVKVSFKPLNEIAPHEMSWFREDLCSAPPFELPTYIRLHNPLAFEKMLLDLIHDYNLGLPYGQLYAKGAFIRLWTHLLREHQWNQNSHLHSHWLQLTKVKHYLNHRLDADLSVEQLAEMANLSSYYFIHLFKQAFGVSPIRYHLMARIEKAKEWIQFTDIPLTEIGERVGFGSIHAFSRAFKKIEGVPPSFYRSKKK
ncbi:AraC family transcriptional regulator [Paenibacillus flagellatus]|uniref:AraC family transcriptional regulator n=1 Tax=Paenibacillus flagellatus TaxID=2211139 RepID=A0A2V5KBR2_9BACL|nr:AraC family transcriptional regulator [Paenibacillus flagellatus]PYI55584.1 AraC family transcriptional regulator [Paenibacillus flagellatus]